jgi:hypothetical protein
MGNAACNCKKKEEVEEITIDEPIISKTPAQDQSERENGLSVRESENRGDYEEQPISSRNQKSLRKSNSNDNMLVEINEDNK